MSVTAPKPVVRGPVDGNALAIMAAVKKAIWEFYDHETAYRLDSEYHDRATSGDYNHLLRVSMEFADFELEPSELAHGEPGP